MKLNFFLRLISSVLMLVISILLLTSFAGKKTEKFPVLKPDIIWPDAGYMPLPLSHFVF
jgi:hypothetical protein